MKNIFIDGQTGTTGLQIAEKLKLHSEINQLIIEEADRKNDSVKLKMMEKSDCIILCLPDESSRNSVELIEKNFGSAGGKKVDYPGWPEKGGPTFFDGRRENCLADFCRK